VRFHSISLACRVPFASYTYESSCHKPSCLRDEINSLSRFLNRSSFNIKTDVRLNAHSSSRESNKKHTHVHLQSKRKLHTKNYGHTRIDWHHNEYVKLHKRTVANESKEEERSCQQRMILVQLRTGIRAQITTARELHSKRLAQLSLDRLLNKQEERQLQPSTADKLLGRAG